MADVTTNRNYERILITGAEPAEDIAAILHDMVTSIDTDVQDIVDTQATKDGIQDSDITTAQADIVVNTNAITSLTKSKRNLADEATSTDLTYDANGNVTLFETAIEKFFNFVYTDGDLTQYDYLLKATSVTYRYVLTYTSGNLTSIARSTL